MSIPDAAQQLEGMHVLCMPSGSTQKVQTDRSARWRIDEVSPVTGLLQSTTDVSWPSNKLYIIHIAVYIFCPLSVFFIFLTLLHNGRINVLYNPQLCTLQSCQLVKTKIPNDCVGAI